MTKHIGRPSSFTPAVADAICERLAAGESLRAICRDDGMPSDATVRQWALQDRDGFAARYALSRDMGLDAVADDIITMVDEPIGKTDQGATDTGMVAAKRLRFDARRWYLSKLAPKRYGDRLNVELAGHLALSDMSEDEIKAELTLLVGNAVAGLPCPSGDDSDLV